jgi:hypothetical protein
LTDFRKLLEQSRDAFNARDPEAWNEAWNGDCEWHPFLTAREEGDPGYHGHNGVRAWFEDVDEMFSEIHVDLEQYRQIGHRLLVLAWVVEPRGEKLHRGWSYGSHAEGERAAEEAAR